MPECVRRSRVGVRLQAEDFVDPHGDRIGNLEQGAVVLQHRFRPARGPGPQDPVVNGLDGGSKRHGDVIKAERSPDSAADRTRRHRARRARGAVRKELGVALVQARDGVAQSVGGEHLGPPLSSARVDLDQD